MAVEQIELELIDDNPFNPRKHYPRKKIEELAYSINQHGLLETPRARQVNGRYQLAFGGLRKRAFEKLAKAEGKTYNTMPVDIQEISDEQMLSYALEENIKRADLTPIELARSIDSFCTMFPGKSEGQVGQVFKFTQAAVSNMRRVLRCPEAILEKVDEGIINFTMARELLAFDGLPNTKELMLQAISNLKTGNKNYGEPITVEGMQKAVHSVARSKFKALERGIAWYGREPDFDTREAGCLKCEKMVLTHPTKSQANHWCTNPECWEKKQTEHQEKMAVEAKAQMQEDILRQAAAAAAATPTMGISQEIPKAKALVLVNEGGGAIPTPCETCTKADTCDRSYFHVADDSSGRLVCEEKIERAPEEVKIPAPEIPEETLALAREKAGTRAEVLDIKDLTTGNEYSRQYKAGFAILKGSYHDELRYIADPLECTERCTQGFHYAFDSSTRDRDGEGKPLLFYVCSNPKCLSQKKAAFTRAKNAEGQARKKAETKAIKQALADTTTLDRPRMKLILLSQLTGEHISKYYYGESKAKSPEKWLWDKLSAGTKDEKRTQEALFKAIDKLTDVDLAQLVVEFSFYYLTDKGNLQSYEVKTAKPLKWCGIDLEKAVGGD